MRSTPKALQEAAEVESGADREDANNQLRQGNCFEYGTALRQTALYAEWRAENERKLAEAGGVIERSGS